MYIYDQAGAAHQSSNYDARFRRYRGLVHGTISANDSRRSYKFYVTTPAPEAFFKPGKMASRWPGHLH